MEAKDPRAAQVIAFWFAAGPRDKRWFEKSEAFDAEIRERFGAALAAGIAGAFGEWCTTPRGSLARVLLLDQFPRNMFRGSARAFATDALALRAARHALDRGYDRGVEPAMRTFFYLPFEHAESLEAQDTACRLTEPLAAFPETFDVHRYALRHREIVARFGRFPHRNAALGRASTAEELEFLKQPGSSF